MTYKQETIKPYGQEGSKGEQVEQMFDTIAPTYDLLNHALSLGIDRSWRKAAIAQLKPHAPRRILDVATGTGDFAILAARELHPESLLGVDLSEGMMNEGRRKVREAGLDRVISFQREDCLQLSLPTGGHLVIVELTAPARFPMKQLFWLYAHVLMPLVGRIVSRDSRAYAYLPATMEAFPQGEQMQKILEKAGFAEVRFKRFTFGLSTLYVAQKGGGDL